MNVYEIVTNRIIDELERGQIPWHKPWTGTVEGAYNRVSKRPYSLLNQMLLKHAGEYATFKQWQQLGGKVRKGEKSEIVVFWKMHKVEELKDGEKVTKTIPLLRYYNVFHVSQVDGVEPLAKSELVEHDPIADAEAVRIDYLLRSGVKYTESVQDRAYYSPAMDMVSMPKRGQFADISEYYSTMFHELTHSTGHKTRLDRFSTGKAAAFGGEEYSKEELVAEIGSASILNILGIETPKSFRNSTAYIQSWIKALKNDTRLIVSAGSKAEKAANLILNRGEA